MAVRVSDARYWTPSQGRPTVTYRVLVDGVSYFASEQQLQQLYMGVSPEDLELTPCETDRPVDTE